MTILLTQQPPPGGNIFFNLPIYMVKYGSYDDGVDKPEINMKLKRQPKNSLSNYRIHTSLCI